MTQRLQAFYSQTIVPKLKNKLQYTNTLAVPKLKKIVINRGLGDVSKESSNSLDSWKQELSILSGQTGVVTRSKKDIAGFKIRRRNPVGVSVTLRGNRMYGFLDRLINLALPRIRDFQGVSPSSLDGHGNYSIGLSEQYMFPEISYDKISKVRGMDISIVTSSKTDEECYSLLKEFGMPFKEKNR